MAGGITNTIYQGNLETAKKCTYVAPFVWNGEKIGLESWSSFVEQYYGMHLNFCTKEEMMAIIDTESYQQMATFPETDSVKRINGVFAMKFRDDLPVGE